MIVFLTHKINPKVFCPNFGVHFNAQSSLFYEIRLRSLRVQASLLPLAGTNFGTLNKALSLGNS